MQFSKFTSETQDRLSAAIYLNRKYWLDVVIIAAVALVAGFLSYQGANLVNPVILDEPNNIVKWFAADTTRVFSNMTDRASDHNRIKVHPLFSLIAFPPVYLLRVAFNLDPLIAVRIVIAVLAALCLGTLFLLLRLMGCRRLDALLFSGLATSSAAAMCWFVVPETYSFGVLSILVALVLVALSQQRQFSEWWYVGVSALTLSFTTTNWMVGLLATFVNCSYKRVLQISVNAFALVTVLWGMQKWFFPTAVFFLGDREEKNYITPKEAGGPLHVLKSFVAHTMVIPDLNILHQPNGWNGMLTQLSAPGSGTFWGMLAVVLWTSLLGLGLWAFFSTKEHPKLRATVGTSLLAQLGLHTVYGEETFLYSLHFLPLFIVIVAFSSLTRLRLIALGLTTVLIVFLVLNNSTQFGKAIQFLRQYNTPSRFLTSQLLLDPPRRPTGFLTYDNSSGFSASPIWTSGTFA